MANTYKRLGIDLLATGGTDIRVKTRISDSSSGFLDDKIQPALSGKITKSIGNPFGNETLVLDVDETVIDHDLLLNFEIEEHRVQDDAQTTTSTLWSSQKIQDGLDEKVNRISPVADNRLLKSVGTTGVDMEQTSITVDDSGNVTGIQDMIVTGDLTVNGTTTSINSTNLDVSDANITVNDGGTEVSADLGTAGLTVEMSDATNVALGFDSTLTSKMKVGEVGDLREIATTTHTQSLLNKTIDLDSNTVSNIELDNFKTGVIDLDDTLSTADDTKVPTSLTVKNYVDTAVLTKDEASEITFTPAGDIIATNVQDAIEEVDNEKVAISNFSSLFGIDFAAEDTDGLSEGIANLYFTDARAKTSAVVNSTTGNETDQAPSVDAIKTYINNATPAGSLAKASGDIDLTSFIGANNVSGLDVTGLLFDKLVVRSFKALVSVSRDATLDLFEAFEILGLNRGGVWEISYSSLGDLSGVTFDIDNDGQVTYDSTDITGHISTELSFRALVTHI